MEDKIFAEGLRNAMSQANMKPGALAKELGVSRATVYKWLSGLLPSHRHARALEARFGLSVSPVSNFSPSDSFPRRVPLIEPASVTPNGSWSVDLKPQSWLRIEETSSPNAMAFRIVGDAMEPEFHAGEIVIVDPSIEPKDGDFVIAAIEEEGQKQGGVLTFHQYRTRGHYRERLVYDLVPLNPSYRTKTVGSHSPGRIIGTVIEHRRRFHLTHG